MKKIIFKFLVAYFVIAVSFCFAGGRQEMDFPQWLDSNLELNRKKFSESQYLAFLAFNPVEETATESAIASLANYLQAEISVSSTSIIEDSLGSSNKDNIYKETFREEVSVKSNLVLRGLKTETFYHPQKNIFYAVAYINRAEAVKSQTQKIATLYEKCQQTYDAANEAEKAGDKFTALRLLNKATALITEIEKEAEFVAILKPNTKLSIDTKNLSNIANMAENFLQKITIFYDIANDSDDIISKEIFSAFKTLKFSRANKKENADYIVKVKIDENLTNEGDLLCSFPSVMVELAEKQTSLYSAEFTSTEKTLSYDKQKLKRKALQKLASGLSSRIATDIADTVF